MTHDFAKKSRPIKKKAKPKSQVPGWVWLFTGIVAGVFISFLGYLADFTPATAPEQISAKVEAVTEQAKEAVTTKFDFYTLLPEREVIVPIEEQTNNSAPKEATLYILQAGSFKTAADADRLRAQLIMMDLKVKVDEVATGNGTWHRVQVGPFKDRSRLSKARNTLIEEGIETLLLKRKAEG
ncbi:MAG: cell division protein FtsN [Oceanicoccus sp.]|jgi:cell division protein FtsN